MRLSWRQMQSIGEVKESSMRILFLCLTFFINIQVFASTAESLHDKIIKELLPDNVQELIDSSVHAQLLDFMVSNPKIECLSEKSMLCFGSRMNTGSKGSKKERIWVMTSIKSVGIFCQILPQVF